MCGSRDTFASKGPQVVKWFAGGAPVKPNDVRWISGAEFKRAFPSEARGFSYDFMKLIPVVDNRDYAVGAIGSSVRPITRRVIFVDTDKPTKCGAMCRNAKGPMCDCSCKGENHGASVAMSRARFAELDLKPTAEMAANAARGLELREKHGKGGTAVGVARARDIKNRANLSSSTVKRMHSFFSRHEGNQKGGEDDAGYIAWLLWGGDAGKAWAARKSEQIDKSESARFSESNATGRNDLPLQSWTHGLGHYDKDKAIRNLEEKLRKLRRNLADYQRKGKTRVVAVLQQEIYAIEHELTRERARMSRSRFSHDIRLPKGKRRLNIDEAYAALAQMGYKLGTVRYDPAAGGSVYKVTQPNGSVIDMPAAKLTDFIYEKAKHMKSGTKTAFAINPVVMESLKFHASKMSDLLRQFIAEAKQSLGNRMDAAWLVQQRAAVEGAIRELTSGRVASSVNMAREWADEFAQTYLHHEHTRQLALLARAIAREPAHVAELAKAHNVPMSRAGAKAAFNKPNTVTVVTVMSGTGGSGGLFKVVGYDENGREYEYGLFAMRSMAEEKAKQIARYKDWSFKASRVGAKAAFAANNVDLWNFLSKSDFLIARQNANDLAKLKKYASMALTMPDFTPPAMQQHGPSLHDMAKDTLADIKKWEEAVYRQKNRAPWNASRAGAKAAFAHPDDAQITSTQLIRGNGRKYEILSRKPASAEARAQLGQTDWLDIRGANGAQYIVQVFNNGTYRVLSSSGKAWQGRIFASRAGAKAAFARDIKVRKGNFTDTVAIVGQNGSDPANWYAGLILRHKDGEEQVLWMKHGYKNEATAQKYALQKFDAHVSRMSRAGAKATMGMYGSRVKDALDAIHRGDIEDAARQAEDLRSLMTSNQVSTLEKLDYTELLRELRSRGVRIWSRAGAKAAFAITTYEQAEHQIALAEERIASVRRAVADTEKWIHRANGAMRLADAGNEMAQKEVISIARMIESAMSHRGFSRAGAKAAFATDAEIKKRSPLSRFVVDYIKLLKWSDGEVQRIPQQLHFATYEAAQDWIATVERKGWFKGFGGNMEKVEHSTIRPLRASRAGAKSDRLTLAQRIAVEHDAKRMANR